MYTTTTRLNIQLCIEDIAHEDELVCTYTQYAGYPATGSEPYEPAEQPSVVLQEATLDSNGVDILPSLPDTVVDELCEQLNDGDYNE